MVSLGKPQPKLCMLARRLTNFLISAGGNWNPDGGSKRQRVEFTGAHRSFGGNSSVLFPSKSVFSDFLSFPWFLTKQRPALFLPPCFFFSEQNNKNNQKQTENTTKESLCPSLRSAREAQDGQRPHQLGGPRTGGSRGADSDVSRGWGVVNRESGAHGDDFGFSSSSNFV